MHKIPFIKVVSNSTIVRRIFRYICIIVTIFLIYLYFVDQWYLAVKPHGDKLRNQVESKSKLRMQGSFLFQDCTYYYITGCCQILPRFPSGDPVYIYDASGILVDWTSDDGEDEIFNNRWRSRYAGEAMSLGDIYNRIQTPTK